MNTPYQQALPLEPIPWPAEAARDLAKRSVVRLLEHGYTEDQADAEYCWFHGALVPEDEWEIRRGKIRAPYESGCEFSFRELAKEIRGHTSSEGQNGR